MNKTTILKYNLNETFSYEPCITSRKLQSSYYIKPLISTMSRRNSMQHQTLFRAEPILYNNKKSFDLESCKSYTSKIYMNLNNYNVQEHNKFLINSSNEQKNYLSTARIYLDEKKSLKKYEFLKQNRQIQSSKFITSLTYSPLSSHQILSKYIFFSHRQFLNR